MQLNSYYLITSIIGALVVGIICGLAPLIAGKVKNQFKLGLIGFICCIVGGFILGIILALPAAIIFTLVITLKKPAETQFQNPPDPPPFSN